MTYINQSDKIYAQSLLELDLANDQVLNELSKINEVLTSSEELVMTLSNPTINISHKTEILEQIFKNKIDEKMFRFLQILTEKNKIKRFESITECFKTKYNEFCNIKEVEIISAIELDNDYKYKIKQILEKKLNKNVMPKWDIDNDIIGGLVFKIGDTVIDTSLKHKLESFSKIMK